ncbi:MAG: dynamin family protein [Verrucomicrobiae bacterium]|nr:dynamin family protein [Verrucomicrobiae bacterium]
MKYQIDYPKLLQSLENVLLLAPEVRPDKALQKIKNLDSRAFDDLIRECRDFHELVERAAEDCKAAVESPIYIGVVGHYSHGKSSLLNSLLFLPKTQEVLPTGEGVVTSLCTLIQFSNSADDHEFYEVANGGEEQYLPPDEYRVRVSGKGGKVGTTSHFKVRLQVSQLSDRLFKDFVEKQIELLDTPGLGGPYWKDEQAMMSWIKEFVMVVVCVKASEINETTAATVNPFLRQTTKPLVPVITFWDLWRKSPDFKGITDEIKARAEARKRLSQFFPSLAPYADEAIFTSAKACAEAIEVPEKESRFFTEEWNVDNVRRSLAYQVQAKGQVLKTQKAKESTLDSQRRAQVRSLAEKLCNESIRYAKNLRARLQETLPKGEQEEILQLFQDDLQKELERETERITAQIDRQFSKAIPLIDSAKDWAPKCASLKQELELVYLEQRKQSASKLVTWFDRFKQTRIEPIIKSSGLKEVERKRLDLELKRHSDEFLRLSGLSLTPPEIISIPNVAFDFGKNFLQATVKGFKQLITTNAPLAIGLLIAFPILASFFWLLKEIPYISLIMLIVVGLYAISLVGVFWSQFQNAIKLSLYQAREKTLQANTGAKIAERIERDLHGSVSSLVSRLSEGINTRLAPLDSDTRDVFDSLAQDLEKLEEAIREVRHHI